MCTRASKICLHCRPKKRVLEWSANYPKDCSNTLLLWLCFLWAFKRLSVMTSQYWHRWLCRCQVCRISKISVNIVLLSYQFEKLVLTQFNHKHNIPPGKPPGIWIFGKFWFKFPPHRAVKLFKCPHPRKNYQIAVLTFQHVLLSLDNTYLFIINVNHS